MCSRRPVAEISLSPIERVIQQVKQNGPDIAKYFILNDEGNIIVKADLQDDSGYFEVVYDLDEAELLEDSSYAVRFTVREKGSETILEDTLVWQPVTSDAGILLSFDDRYTESWERHFDLFDKYGAHVTFFIQGEFTPFCIDAINRGHDVGYHSLTHPDLRAVSREIFMEETVDPVGTFRQAGIPLLSFAYPYGFSESWMKEILLRTFAVLRGYGTTFRLYTESEIRSGFISSRGIDNNVIPGEENFDRSIRSMLMTVKFLEGGRILPLTTHDISESAWGISPRRLEFLLKTATDLKLRFYRFCDFAD